MHLSFSLIPTFFLKLIQLGQFDKASHLWLFMEPVIVWGTGGTEILAAYLVVLQTSNPRASVTPLRKYFLLFNMLNNLTNLFTHNYGKTQLWTTIEWSILNQMNQLR